MRRRLAGVSAIVGLMAGSLNGVAAAQVGGGTVGSTGGNNQGNWTDGRQGSVIKCESWNFKYQECRADTRGGVQLRRVVAGDCSPGNWGYRADRIWVDKGCRAEFTLAGGNGSGWGSGWSGGNGGGQTATVRCESRGYQYRECRADTRGGVRIARVLGGDCQSRNWGYRGDLIWVDKGCRADFAVGSFGGSGGSWGGGNGGGQTSTVRCESRGYQYRECRADTRGGVRIARVLGGDCQSRNWGYRGDLIWVDKGCRADFAVGSFGGSGGSWGGGSGGNQTATVRCESRGYQYKECRADTRGGVRIERVLGGDCQSRNWGYRDDRIWVNNGCRADFAVRGYGQQGNDGGGPSAGLIIGGIAVAAGLAALLASSGKKNDAAATSSVKPARIDVNTSLVPTAARPSFQKCLDEAAKQIGATGGTAISLEEMRDVAPQSGGYRFDFRLKGTWPDETRTLSTICRATNTALLELDFK